MLIWDDSRKLSQKLAQDSSTDAIAFLDMMMNAGYKALLTEFNRQYIEQQATTILVNNQRGYQVPPDCLRPKTLTLLRGSERWPLGEIASDKMWEQQRSQEETGQPISWHYRPRFGIGGGILEMNPVPLGGDYSVEMIYEASERDLSQVKYNTGTAAVNTGANTVTGTGTTFTPDMVGRYWRPTGSSGDRNWYRIGQYISATSIKLETNYQGPINYAAAAYEIAEIFALPEDMHLLPVFYAAWMWWSTKGNAGRTAEHNVNYRNGLKLAKSNHSLPTGDQTFETTNWNPEMFGFDTYPPHFPAGVSS